MKGLELFLLSASEALFLPVPADVYIALYALEGAWWYAFLVGWLGNLTGGVIGYLLGKWLGDRIKIKGVERVERLYSSYGDVAILLASLTPIPYKVFTYASGFLNYPLHRFLLFSAIFRGVRFGVVAYLSSMYGKEGLAILQRPEIVALILLLIGGYWVLKIWEDGKRR